jgi:AcrR family transcriptional regulator
VLIHTGLERENLMTAEAALKKTTTIQTPLTMALNAKRPQATPLEAFKLARKCWLSGQRVSIGELAKELGVSRGTLYRWVGNKDLLMDEIIWSVAKPTFEKAVREAPGTGIENVVAVHRHFMEMILSFEPLQKFVEYDPQYAMRILTRDAVGAHDRLIKEAANHLSRQAADGHMKLPTSAEKLAEIIIRTNEALIYNDIISGRSPAIEQACTITRILLSAGKIPGQD